MNTHRYGNANTPEQQSAADARYRERQRRLRTWADDLAESVGLTRDQLMTQSSAELVAKLLQSHDPPRT